MSSEYLLKEITTIYNFNNIPLHTNPRLPNLYVIHHDDVIVYDYNGVELYKEKYCDIKSLDFDKPYQMFKHVHYYENGIISRNANEITFYNYDTKTISKFVFPRKCKMYFTKDYIFYGYKKNKYITNIHTLETRKIDISDDCCSIYENMCLQLGGNEIQLYTLNKNDIIRTKHTIQSNCIIISFCLKFYISINLIPDTNLFNYDIYKIQPNALILLNTLVLPSKYSTLTPDSTKMFVAHSNILYIYDFVKLTKLNPVLFLILCARRFSPESTFFDLPLDLIKVIANFAEIELSIPLAK